MIKLTRMNKSEFILNVDLIEIIEETPDTVIT
ncbi:MAG: flagellar FlbD family protein, partial [Thermotaleaceae bacterium]